MQTTLLGIALTLIAAILAAFAAPFFIDWNAWRPQLEAQASALAGTRVSIAGNIELTLLPTPAFVVRDVSLGDAEKGTGIRANEMQGSLSLTALLSGKIEASEFVVSRPAIRLVIDKDGKFLLPEGANAGQEISVGGFVLEAGSITIEDRRTNSLFAADDFSARGELVSREGPFRMEGGFRLNGMRWIVRASSGRFGPEQNGKARLSLERPSDNISIDLDGVLGLANAALRFDGKISLAQQKGALPWRVSGDASGDAAELRLSNLELALGQGELPITLSGEGKLVPRANGRLEAKLTSKRIDLDLGDPKAATSGVSQVLPLLSEARALLEALPLQASVAVSADGILAGGQLMRDVRAEFRANDGTVAIERVEARLPGRAAISLNGKSNGEKFSGPFTFEAEEPQIFGRWLLGEELSAKIEWPGALKFQGNVSYTQNEAAFDIKSASIEQARLSGRILLQDWKSPRFVIQADLQTKDANLDAILPLLSRAQEATGELKYTLNLYAENSRLFGRPLKTLSLAATHLEDTFFVKSLVVDDLDGVSLKGKHKGDQSRVLEYSLEASRPVGLLGAIEYLSGSSDLGGILTKYSASYFPLKLTGSISPLKEGWRILANSGANAFSLDLGPRREIHQPIDAKWLLPETEISARGELRFSPEGRVEPLLALEIKSENLSKAFPFAERAAGEVLQVAGTTSLFRDGNSLVFDRIYFELGGSKGTGRITLPIGETSPFAGKLAIDRVSAATLLSFGLGRAKDRASALNAPLLANVTGTLSVEAEMLSLTERLSIQKASFDLRTNRLETLFENLRGEIAGGKVTGSLRVTDTTPRVADGKLELNEVSLERLIGKTVRGTLRSALAFSASGNSQDALVSSIAGQGSITLSNIEIERTDATAVSAVLASTAQETPDEKKIEQALLAALDRAPLKVSKLDMPLVIANGVVRSGSAKAQAGNIEISLSGNANLTKRVTDLVLNIELNQGSAVKPGAIVRWSGPFDAVERSVDAKALIAAITLRAIERGARNPSNVSQPLDDRPPAAKKKRQPSKSEIESAPLLPPPSEIVPAPQPRSQN